MSLDNTAKVEEYEEVEEEMPYLLEASARPVCGEPFPRHYVLNSYGERVTTPIGRYRGKWGDYAPCAEEKAVLAELTRYFGLEVFSRPAGRDNKRAWFEVAVPLDVRVACRGEDKWGWLEFEQ